MSRVTNINKVIDLSSKNHVFYINREIKKLAATYTK